MERVLGGRGHYNMQALLGISEQILRPVDVSTFFKFGFVRNPYSRLVSLYLWRGGPDDGFKPWLFDTSPQGCKEPTQAWFLCHAADNRLLCDFVGRFERIIPDWDYVCRQLGISTPLPWVKTGTRHLGRDYTSYYDDESAAEVQRRYAVDFELFGYRTELVPGQLTLC